MTNSLANPHAIEKQLKATSIKRWLQGIGFTFVIALAGLGLSQLPGLDRVGQLACAILIAVVYRQVRGYPEAWRTGIQFSSKRLLRLAIVLFGLKLNLDVVFHQGLGLLVRDAGTIVFSIFLTMFLAKLFKADASLSFLLGIGTGVCGAAAIAAVSPILKAREEDTAMGAGLIALVGTLFALAYSLIRPFLPLTALQYGIWAGVSLHEIAHVALAGTPAGPDALAIALLAKLGRVFLLVPLSFILMYGMKRKGRTESDSHPKVEFPWFLIGFLITSFLGSYVLGHALILSPGVLNGISLFTSFILTMAMVGLGLNVSLKDLRTKMVRPLLAMSITSVLLAFLTYFTI
ncbi:putative sulfate exporter family transporter [Paenibacillus aurantius]|uniref:Sulfate exporter family transporter n=1 Tax=Paenibacillus aurantius TaxID=2918900 RepID=A0AA96RHK4_9BACL|nr:putative sulfate exporter family transporter [Paenibacillus aurantius]WNQ11204.1 putative sulfate exporter family transporter [Paenibacillus aurantius]